MALNASSRQRPGSIQNFLLRLTGLSGLMLVGLGLVLWSVSLGLLGILLASAGGLMALIALVAEIRTALELVSGRRGALASNVAVQILLAIILLVGINFFSFFHYQRLDCTRDHRFTIQADILKQLSELRQETTIVVLQQHSTLGQLASKPDNYDSAAERKVVEKVKDLVEQFQELGPKFKVVVLDVQDESFAEKLSHVTEAEPVLREAIDRAPENSIFFYAAGKVQRLGFQDIYQLDKQASQEADDGRGNLILVSQGIEPFAHKILNLDEKRPKIAVAVVHEVLGLHGEESLGLPGLRKSLDAHGFDYEDIILKKWDGMGPPEPGIFTADESKFERLEVEIASLQRAVKLLKEKVQIYKDRSDLFENTPLKELNKKLAAELEGRSLSRDDVTLNLELAKARQANYEANLQMVNKELNESQKQMEGLNVDSIGEKRRITDLKSKAERMLADCDLLIVPRLTLRNVARRDYLPNRVHRWDEAQAAAAKEFLKAGKPVLACFGPGNEVPEDSRSMTQFGPPGPDPLEKLFGDLGIRFGGETVIFGVESKTFDESRSGLSIAGAEAEVPAVVFDVPPSIGQSLARTRSKQADNPIRNSMSYTARSMGKDRQLELRLRNPRPITVDRIKADRLAFEPRFMMSSLDAVGKTQPFPSRGGADGDDLDQRTPSDANGPPYTLGVALEETLPASWYDKKGSKPALVRVGAIGHGGVFGGATLSPAREKLFYDTCNWLIGRDDLLTKKTATWEYPRVLLSSSQTALWQWAARLGLPMLFVYAGMVVLLVRRLR